MTHEDERRVKEAAQAICEGMGFLLRKILELPGEGGCGVVIGVPPSFRGLDDPEVLKIQSLLEGIPEVKGVYIELGAAEPEIPK